MSELPFEDERVQRNLKLLMQYMQHFVGEPMNSNTVENIQRVIEEFRVMFKAEHGHEFPKLVPFILPTSRFIAWFRADLDDREIYIKLINMLREFSVNHIPVREVELATAISMCWPSYKSDVEAFRNIRQIDTLH